MPQAYNYNTLGQLAADILYNDDNEKAGEGVGGKVSTTGNVKPLMTKATTIHPVIRRMTGFSWSFIMDSLRCNK